ncbi:hypothetical protein BJV74DRAFT_817006 [Russula compacta]|nr:hypothetical protein BJV74DRAFT_817006 [Russula compacta]
MAMFSPLKIALFSLISLATLALAVPTQQDRSQDLKALISSTNLALQSAVQPLNYLTSANETSDCIGPVIYEVVVIVTELVSDLQGSSLSGCGCTTHDIVELIAITLNIIFEPLGIVYGSYSGLGALLGNLVSVIVELLDVVLALVGGLVWELLALLIGNGCARVILNLQLGPLINALGLGGLLGNLL